MTTIRQEVAINSSAKKIYDVLTNAEQFSAMSGGAPTQIAKEVGGEVSLFGGMIVGRTIELVPNERIVQAWRVKLWPAGVYSLVKFELTSKGNDTLVTLEHAAFPEEQREHLAKGWQTNYFEPLQKLLGT